MTGTYRIADRVVEITSVYPGVHRFCADYRDQSAGKSAIDLAVETTAADVEHERICSDRSAISEGREPGKTPDAYLESLAVYRKIAEGMVDFDTFLFHGSVVAVDGEAYLFTAKSGTGKSTHTALWRDLFGERAVMINDDKPLLRVCEDRVIVYGTPYNGKHKLGTNTSAPLRAICILERAAENTIRPVTANEAYRTLVQQTYRPRESGALAKTLSLLDRAIGLVGLYRLGCNMDIEAARVAYEGMKGDNK